MKEKFIKDKMKTEKNVMQEGAYMNQYLNRRFMKNKNILIAVTGGTGCLSGDTEVKLTRGKACRNYKLEELFNRFLGKITHKNMKRFNLTIPSFIRSFNGKDIKLHKIKNIVYSGEKEVYELTLENGLILKATPDHKIMTKNGWIELQNLQNEEIMCDTLKAEAKQRKRIKLRDIGLAVGRNHPYNIQPNGQISVHTLIYEAYLNNLKFLDYLDALLNEPEKCKEFNYINPRIHLIHHIDGNHYNNNVENLKCIKIEEHTFEHNNYSNFSQGLPKWSKVRSIKRLAIEKTYDIICEEPYHNFVAEGIVVHNSGKTYGCLRIVELFYKFKFNQDFPKDHICFSIMEVVDLLKSGRLKKGDVLILEEAGANLGSLDFQQKVSKLFTYILQSFRSMNVAIIMNLPVLTMLNKQTRQLLHAHMITNGIDFTAKKCEFKMRLHQLNQHTGKSYWKCPRIIIHGHKVPLETISYGLPSKYITDDYEVRKAKFVNTLVSEYEDKTTKTKEELQRDAKEKRDNERSLKRNAELEKRKDNEGKVSCGACGRKNIIIGLNDIKCRVCGHTDILKY